MSDLGQVSVAGHPAFSSILIFLCFSHGFMMIYHDSPMVFPYLFPCFAFASPAPHLAVDRHGAWVVMDL